MSKVNCPNLSSEPQEVSFDAQRRRIRPSHPVLLAVLLAGLLNCLPGCAKQAPEEKFRESMSKAEEFIKAEKWDEARISLMKAIEAKGDDANSHYQLAEIFMRQKKIGPAIDQYETSLNLDPNFRDARLKIAAIKLGGNQIEGSESDVQKLLELNPDDSEALMLKAAIAKIKNRLPEARQILEQLIEKNPDNNLALAALGDVSIAEGKVQAAEDLFNRSLKIDPKNAAVRLALADLYIKQNRLDESQGIIESLIDKDPSNTTLRFFLGEFLLARGSGEKATEQYREILKSDPRRHDARDRLYDLYLLNREVPKAKELTADLEKLEPTQPGTSYFKGRDLEVDGNIQEALTTYLKAIIGLPGFAPLFRHTGVIELSIGKAQEGVEHLNQAVSINGADVGARIALARHYFVNKDFAQAKEHANAVLKLFPRQIGANIIRADIALLEGETELAETVYKALADTLPNNPIGYFKLAALEETKKNAPKALEFYKKGLSFDQDIMVPGQRFAQILSLSEGVESAERTLLTLRDNSKNHRAEYNTIIGSTILTFSRGRPTAIASARKYLSEAITEQPDLLPAYFSLAQMDAIEGKLADSEQNYRKILERQPQHVPSRMLLAMSLEMRGQKDDAMSEYRRILEVSPNFAAAANNLAWLIASTGKGSLDEALDLAIKAKQKLPQVSSVADTLGWIYFKRDTPKAALPILEEAVELERKNAPEGPSGGGKLVNSEILYHLAVVQSVLGLKDEAKKTASEALRHGGENLPFYAELRKIVEG